ncbi:MAG: aldo/keto reductase [Ruminococcaceae bacterium]|nr:aldo/keto reductase [Oscillospiraceae bacterium]
MKNRVKLNDGSCIPSIGYGCYKVSPDEAERLAKTAIECGYRMIDTAIRYENEAEIGRAVKSSGLFREELYIVSKVWQTCYDRPVDAIEFSLKELDCDYIDLYYLHWPATDAGRRYRMWEAILNYREKGLIKSVGVSNFKVHHIKDLIEQFGVAPAANQVELHPLYQQREVSEYCEKEGIKIVCWAPIMRGKFDEIPALFDIGERYGKTPAQVVLRWHIQSGRIPLPKSSSRERMTENIDVFDFELSDEEMGIIGGSETGFHFGRDPDIYDGEDFVIEY